MIFTKKVAWHGSDQALALVHQALTKNSTSIQQIKKIFVVRGPGGFTAVRTGLLIANTIGTALRIPVVGVTSEKVLSQQRILQQIQRPGSRTSVRPHYGKEPNISTPTLRRR